MTIPDLPPIEGTWVRKLDDESHIGFVTSVTANGSGCDVEVDWGPRGRERITAEKLRCGLLPDFVVQDVPLSATRRTLGPARVLAVREIAGCEQALVQLEGDGRLLWLPYQALRRIKDPAIEYKRAEMQHEDAGERWAVKVMAHALRTWNEATGALDRLDVDPLPHQIQLVHKLLMSGHANWIIADDVGLGKTVEVGLLLAALERQGRLRRVLVITPASLTRQWQDEMRTKFERTFEIYGEDFSVDEPWKWKLHDYVIASLDLVKPRGVDDSPRNATTHFGRLLASDTWDLVIFDEAHRLSRRDDGSQTLRCRLARDLRARTNAMLLLTGTPHQGDTGRFRSLLQLVRPDLHRAIQELEFQPDVVREIILRNRKIDVTDLEGNFIFQGHDVTGLMVDTNPAVHALERRLRGYLRQSYHAGRSRGGSEGRAIGFVMTIYRKLASSSVAALRGALIKRLERLHAVETPTDDPPTRAAHFIQLDLDLETDDISDRVGESGTQPFFSAEAEVLQGLLEACDAAIREDRKAAFLEAAIRQLVFECKEKVLIFTEFRGTQSYLVDYLTSRLGLQVSQIHGSQSLDEKLRSVANFEAEVPVLISTEAGGEGFNLHRRCRFLINYDLPWNPTRLVQRIGRLYRYGQERRVKVINLHVRDTIDNEVLDIALTRVRTIVDQMAPLGEEFDDRYRAEILGELLDHLDLSEFLGQDFEIDRSPEQIGRAVERALQAREMERELLDNVTRFDPDQLAQLGNLTTVHAAQFVKRVAPLLGIGIEGHATNIERFELRLPDSLKGVFPELGTRTVIEATTNRQLQARATSLALLDFKSSLFRYMIEQAISAEFGGGFAAISEGVIDSPLVAAFLCRWQNDQGEPLDHQLLMARRVGASIEIDNSWVGSLFNTPIQTLAAKQSSADERSLELDVIRDRVELAIFDSVSRFRHPNDLVLLAVAEGNAQQPPNQMRPGAL